LKFDANPERPYGFAWAAAAAVLATALAFPLRGSLAEANLILIYLLAVAFVSVRFGRKPGILASFLAVLAFDVFLVHPYMSLEVTDPQYLLTFAIMLAVSLIISHLTASLRHQAQIARQRERHAIVLFELSRELSGALSIEQIAEIGERRLRAAFHGRAMFLFPGADGRLVANAEELAGAVPLIARLVFERDSPTTSAGISYLPLRAPMRTRGVLLLFPSKSPQAPSPEQERLLQTCAAQIAVAVERVHYVDVAHGAMLAVESERLRNSLLAAISHDIRTPLAAIVGLASTLASSPGLEAATRSELAQDIQESALRMNRQVANLLDMARLHGGAVTLNRQWQMLEEVVGSALEEQAGALAGRRVDVALPATLPLLNLDAVLLERVLCNLLDNAAKYAGDDAAIAIRAQVDGDTVQVTVEDNGPGIAPGMEEQIFIMFTRGGPETARTGVGLGLAICRTVIEAHGGTISAANRPEGGARFVFALPLGTPPGAEELD
jgi:K+-sensing histidine kinase KdpD